MSVDLLVFGAHPDDAELCCGGWLALAGQRCQRAVVVDLTRGELATNGTPELRAAEAAASAEVLGLHARESLALPDGGLTSEDPAQVAAVAAVIRAWRPSLLLAPWEDARHPDHTAAAQIVSRAAFFAGLSRYRPDLGAPHRALRLLRYPERRDARADFVVDITSVYAQKTAAIRCYQSQLSGASTILTEPLGIDAFTVRDRYWGATIGAAYGEPYLLSAPVPMTDPIAHFQAHPASPVLVPQ